MIFHTGCATNADANRRPVRSLDGHVSMLRGLRSVSSRAFSPANGHYPPLLTRQHLSRRSFASAAVASSPSLPVTAGELLQEVSEAALKQSALNATDITHLADLKALGLGGFTPVGAVENLLSLIHLELHLPWWLSIIGLTVFLRTILLPIVIRSQKNMIHLNNIRPELQRLTAHYKAATESRDAAKTKEYGAAAAKLFKDNNCHPLASFVPLIVQGPLFLSCFLALKKMAELPVPGFREGGFLWFTDLTVPDSYFLLPVLSAATFLLSAELGAEGIPPQQSRMMRYIFRGLAVAMIPLSYAFPQVRL